MELLSPKISYIFSKKVFPIFREIEPFRRKLSELEK